MVKPAPSIQRSIGRFRLQPQAQPFLEAVQAVLPTGDRAFGCAAVLGKEKRAARVQHAADFGQGRLGVGNRAQR